MNNSDFKSIEELLFAYAGGQRKFDNWDFEEDESVQGLDLSGIEFRNCFLLLDFRNANLTNSKFIGCNIKTADFRGANLKNGLIKNCSVESIIFKGAEVENFRFEENYCYGVTTKSGDFEELFKESVEIYTLVKITNGFPNVGGIGNILTGKIIEGEINTNDLLLLNNGTEVPIIEVELINVIPEQRNFAITIPREFDNAEVWHKLYGTELKIKNTTHNIM